VGIVKPYEPLVVWGVFVILTRRSQPMDSSIAEIEFCDKANQLKALGDLLSSVNADGLSKETLPFTGQLIISMVCELEKDHDLLYVEYLKAKDNFNFKEGDEL